MHLFTVIIYCLVYSVFGKHVPDTDPGEDFPLDFSVFGKHIPDTNSGEDFPLDFSEFAKHILDTNSGEDFPLDFAAFWEHIPDTGEDFPSFDLDDSAFDIDLNGELRFDPTKLNSTQKIPGVCFVCKKVVGFVLRKIPRPSSRQVRNALHSVCRRIRVPHWICRKVVHIGRLIHKIVSLHAPWAVCRALHLCWWPLPENTMPEKPAAKPAPPRSIRNHLL
ncbi:uncharacterized protein LOC118787471 [Megalops cyprinoides]|uniref:uncharacterized protein LOC118787471 n=1 Tax=Megalops cyprinoides TaxID=118141 RepID=UPI0018644E86|nr:uncharacterized protein LOC118787471 [Megalops cyprinoides]